MRARRTRIIVIEEIRIYKSEKLYLSKLLLKLAGGEMHPPHPSLTGPASADRDGLDLDYGV